MNIRQDEIHYNRIFQKSNIVKTNLIYSLTCVMNIIFKMFFNCKYIKIIFFLFLFLIHHIKIIKIIDLKLKNLFF
jgi:hypothetical protein